MGYFITGGTGFIGRHLVALLATRGEPIYLLTRPGSRARLDRVVKGCGEHGRVIVPVEGDLDQPLLGVRDPQLLRGKVQHFLHLGALYDLAAGAVELERANVQGTRNALALAQETGAGCFHLVSSIAIAGRYCGRFTEDMFDQATGLDHPYFRTKHESEALVRSGALPWRVYRPGMVVGHSATGAMDKIDGPYYLFKVIQQVRSLVPAWLPLPAFEGGHINLVPVDFVAAAIDHLVHRPGLDGRCFHLTDPQDRRIGAVLNLFAGAAHAPTMSLRLDPASLESLGVFRGAARELERPLRQIARQILQDLGVPPSAVELLDYPTIFEGRGTAELLLQAGIRVPRLEDYAWRLWDYWERHLDPDLSRPKKLERAVKGKSVLITGGSSGIGRATALRLAQAGARLLIVARDPQKLEEVRKDIEACGGSVSVYACDITEESGCNRFMAQVLEEHGHVDILINNAGRSIRRAIEHTYDRFHDYERLMRINYFAAVRLTLGLLPSMVQRGSGHVIAISSIGVLSNAPRFAAYNASKAALEAFSRCAAAEYDDRGIRFTVVNMPLVRTPMVAPTKIFQHFPLISPEKAAEIVCNAIADRPERLATSLGILARVVEMLVPRINTAIQSETFKMFPESVAAGGAAGSDTVALSGLAGLASLLQGVSS